MSLYTVHNADVQSAQNGTVRILAWMMFLAPAVGVPNELMLQDTLKSAIVAFGVLLAALFFFWRSRHSQAPMLWHGLVWIPLTLTLYALGSMAWSHPYLAGVEAVRWFVLSLLLWLGLNTLTRENLPTLVWGLHGGATVASVWAVLQFCFDWSLFPQGAPPASTFYNRNFYAEYSICILPFSVWLLASASASRWLGLLALSVGVNAVALFMSGTRSALLALLVLIPTTALVLIRHRKQFAFTTWGRYQQFWVGAILVMSIGALGNIPSQAPQLIQAQGQSTALQRSILRTASVAEAKEYTEGSFSIRSLMWKATARMMVANPWFGVGAGAWEVQVPLYQRMGSALETDYYAHNEFLQLLSEYGLVTGGLVLAFLLAYLLKAAETTFRLKSADSQEATLRATALSTLLVLLIASNAGFCWHLAGCAGVLVLSLSLLAGSDVRLQRNTPVLYSPLQWGSRCSKGAAVAIVGMMMVAAYITQQAIAVESKILGASQFMASLSENTLFDNVRLRSQMEERVREGIAINPHYRKLTAEIAEQFEAVGDWENAARVLESIAASRPHITAVWYGLAKDYSLLGKHEQAARALEQVRRLQPDTLSTAALEVLLLSRNGQADVAAQKLWGYYSQGSYDYNMLQTGYLIGLEAHNGPLAARSLELRNSKWPQQAADGFFKLGFLYSSPDFPDETKAKDAFEAALTKAPAAQKESYIQQMPKKYQPHQ